ncbi:MAG: radical SAM protein [Pseudomonadota bacterium]|nr:radical SAM protein [Pseudomonadota bacterium]
MILGLRNFSKNLHAYAMPSRVGFVILYVTNQCNFRCDFCFYYAEIEKGRKANELTLDEIDKIARSTGSLLQLSLTGGEPFLRKDFDEIVKIFVRHTGVKYITIPTNASMPDRMVRFLETVLPANPDTYFRLAFSIDGIGPQHDQNRSMPGSFEKIINSYKAVSPLRRKFNNLVLDTNTVFTANTENNILEILKHLDAEFEFDNHTVTYARGEIKDPALKTRAEGAYREMNSFLNGLERKKEKRFLYPLYRGVRDVAWDNLMQTVFEDKFVTPCVAGRKMIVISETGEVKPCEILDKTMGNLRDYDFDIYALLKNRQNDELRDWIVKTECKCSFECALAANVTWNKSMYPKLVTAALRNVGAGTRNV